MSATVSTVGYKVQQVKLKSGFGAIYAIKPGNSLGLSYSFQGPHG